MEGLSRPGQWLLEQQLPRYETLEKAQQEYLTFLEEELLEDHAIDDAVPLAQLPSEKVHALQ
jgi:hypothetical protein